MFQTAVLPQAWTAALADLALIRQNVSSGCLSPETANRMVADLRRSLRRVVPAKMVWDTFGFKFLADGTEARFKQMGRPHVVVQRGHAHVESQSLTNVVRGEA